jgi:phage head maturation protease
MPVLPESIKDTLKELESEADFQLDTAEVKRVAVSHDITDLKDGERAAIGYISTRDVDHVGEVLVPNGAILKYYKTNPVVLWAHDYSMPPVAKADWVESDGYGVQSKRTYAETPRADEVWQLIKGGFIKTTSVGFIGIEGTWKGGSGWQSLVDKYNTEWNTDLEKSGCTLITTKWALLEYSDVPVPCNPGALTIAVAKGMSLSPQLINQLGLDDITEAVDEVIKHQKPSVIQIISTPKSVIQIIESAYNLIDGRA